MDSQEKEFFTEAVLRTVFTSCVGFARNVNDMIRRGDVRVVTGAPGDLRVSRDAGDESLLRRYAGFVRVEEDAFRDYAAGMTLNVGFFNAYLEDAGT